jgi:hypothetical protein
MKKYVYNSTVESPEININLETGQFELSGRSIMYYPQIFYKSILEILDNYSCNSFHLVLTIDYLNSASVKYFILLLKKIESYNLDVKVDWYYDSDDDDIEELGYDLSKLFSSFRFNYITI